ncbi:protein NUCLEAR FUSION DEFECTIVE 4-like isoform X2 [Mangifera indica]|uniref:protein NUCLEAR FUSION DEFECTIVE 4-like isoform X2 n=1 Tax=Mangifera indica TaxID=29780 RepID=UPI001CFAF4A4|nr:protein NUCLEAR FUSION DEFECTIVE 4-like isoform X2 [Mangifera indica]
MKKQALKSGSRPPWVGLAAAVWVEMSAGNAYNFPLYSSKLKSVMGFNQQQVTILGVANDIGENVGLLPGIACNKFPPWAVLLVGVVFCFLGYGVLWLAVSQTVSGMPYWLLFLALVIGTNSNAWFGTAVLVTNMRNFPLSRGTVAGILKGYVGISAAVYTALYSMVLKESATRLLLFLTLGIPVICLVMMYLIRACTPASGEDSSVHAHFIFTQAASVIFAIYVTVISITSDVVSLSETVSYILIAIMVVIMMSPLGIPIKMTFFPVNTNKSTPAGSSDDLVRQGGDSTQTDPLLTPSSSATSLDTEDDVSDIETLLAVGEGAVKKKRRPRRGEDFKLHEAFIKADFWLLWVVYFLGVGSGVTVLNNLAQIGIALGVDDTTTLLCVFSLCNFAGRLGSGAVSEHFVRSNTIPRTVWITITHLIMVLTFLLYASALNGTLYAATALLGLCYGIIYSLMVPTASELFGLKHFEASRQGSSTCLGAECFRLTFLILAGVCGLGTILSTILTIRIRPVYQMLYGGGSFRLPQTSGH